VCFSPEADFVSGALVGVVGVATLRQTRSPREIPLAALPLGLAAHQVTEGFVWLGAQGRVASSTGNAAIYLYLAFAWALLPALAPFGTMLIEPDRRRRRIMLGLVALGLSVGAYLLLVVARASLSAQIVGHSIVYRGVGDAGDLVTVLYVVATCGTFLASSSRPIRWFGALNLAAAAVIAVVQSDGLTSLWCLWAALISVFLYLHFADRRRRAEAAEAADARGPVDASRPSARAPGRR
jgi:hypothetical protein